jgi:hypothetical protein
MSTNEYRCFAGLVQFDPRTRTVGDRTVRDIRIRSIGTNKAISVTVWPSHAHIPINKGDFIVADGAYEERPGQDKNGAQTTYHNLSASYLVRIAADGVASSETSAPSEKPAKDETSSFDDIF